jgi:hypothetical protein
MRSLAKTRLQRLSNPPRQYAAAPISTRKADGHRRIQIQAAPSSDSSGTVENTPSSTSTPGEEHQVPLSRFLLIVFSRCRLRSRWHTLLHPLSHPLPIPTTPHPSRYPRRSIWRSLHHNIYTEPPVTPPPRPHRHTLPLPTPHLHNAYNSSHLAKINLHLPRSPPPNRNHRLEDLPAQSPPSLDRQYPNHNTQPKPPPLPRPLGQQHSHRPRPPRSNRQRKHLLHRPRPKRNIHSPPVQHPRLLHLLPHPAAPLPLQILNLQPPNPDPPKPKVQIHPLLPNLPLHIQPPKIRHIQISRLTSLPHPDLVPKNNLGRPSLPPIHRPNYDINPKPRK